MVSLHTTSRGRGGAAGFTLVESLIAIALVAVLVGMAMVALTRAKTGSKSESAGIDLQRSARIVVDELARVLQQTGYGIDRSASDNPAGWQRGLIHAGAYAVAFNVDLDPGLGPIDASQQLTFPTGETYNGEGPSATTLGAETWVFGLDANGDDSLTLADRTATVSGGYNPAATTRNELDFALFRRIHGYDGTAYVTELAPIGGQLFLNAVAGVEFADGTVPEPLFTYLLTEDLNDDGLLDDGECVNDAVDTCPPATPRAPVIYLWGDTDFDGRLSDNERRDLRTRPVGDTAWGKNPLLSGGAYASTTLASSVTAGDDDRILTVNDASNLVVGSHLIVGSGGTRERVAITSITLKVGADVVGLTSAPTFSHSVGETVTAAPETLLRAVRAIRVSVTAISDTHDSDPGGAPVGNLGRKTTHGMQHRIILIQRTIHLENQRTVPRLVELLLPFVEEARRAVS